MRPTNSGISDTVARPLDACFRHCCGCKLCGCHHLLESECSQPSLVTSPLTCSWSGSPLWCYVTYRGHGWKVWPQSSKCYDVNPLLWDLALISISSLSLSDPCRNLHLQPLFDHACRPILHLQSLFVWPMPQSPSSAPFWPCLSPQPPSPVSLCLTHATISIFSPFLTMPVAPTSISSPSLSDHATISTFSPFLNMPIVPTSISSPHLIYHTPCHHPHLQLLLVSHTLPWSPSSHCLATPLVIISICWSLVREMLHTRWRMIMVIFKRLSLKEFGKSFRERGIPILSDTWTCLTTANPWRGDFSRPLLYDCPHPLQALFVFACLVYSVFKMWSVSNFRSAPVSYTHLTLPTRRTV